MLFVYYTHQYTASAIKQLLFPVRIASVCLIKLIRRSQIFK